MTHTTNGQPMHNNNDATAPVDTAPVDTAPVDTTPVDTTPVDTPPVDTPPVDTPPVDTPPVDTPGLGSATPAARDGHRLHTGALFTPNTLARPQRRAITAAARRIHRTARHADHDATRAQLRAERAHRRATRYLPAGGDPGPDALRSYRRLRLPPHRATSDVLAGAYPFLAEAGLGSDGMLIGTDAWSGSMFCFDPWVLYQHGVLTNPNIVLAGVLGMGKSALAKTLATRSVLFGRRVYVPGDVKGEWTPVTRTVGGHAVVLGPGLPARLNPLDEGHRAGGYRDADWQAIVRTRRYGLVRSLAEVTLARPLHPVEVTALGAAIDDAVRRHSTPTLPHVVAALFEPSTAVTGSTVTELTSDGRDAAHALARLVTGDLAGLFDGASTERFDTTAPMLSIDLSAIEGSDELLAVVQTCASAWMEAALTDPNGGKRWVIHEEAWRVVRMASLLSRMQTQWKLSRGLGIANMAIIHRMSDLRAVGNTDSQTRNVALGLLADCSTRIVYNQEPGEAEQTGTALGLSSTETAALPDLVRGEGLWRVKSRSFVVQHHLTPNELRLIDSDARMNNTPAV